jgi:hypothetical protein
MMNAIDLRENCHSLIKILSRYMRGGTEENREESESGLSKFRPRFEPKIFKIHVQSDTSMPTRLLDCYLRVGGQLR